MKLLAQRPTHIYTIATVLLITKTFITKYYERRERERMLEKWRGNETD